MTSNPPTATAVVGGRNLVTPHLPEAYPGLRVLRHGPSWTVSLIVLEPSSTLHARGGERLYAYQTADGASAEGFVLAAGDRATLCRVDLPHAFAEWRLERA